MGIKKMTNKTKIDYWKIFLIVLIILWTLLLFILGILREVKPTILERESQVWQSGYNNGTIQGLRDTCQDYFQNQGKGIIATCNQLANQSRGGK